MQRLKPDTDSRTHTNLISAYRAIATSTIGHLTTAGYVPQLRPIALPDIDADQTSVQISHSGRVLTVTLASDDTEVIRRALSSAAPQDVLCIDARVLGERACWGALRTCAAIYEQLAGVIVLGTVTDSATLATLPMPIFAMGVSALTTSKPSARHTCQDESGKQAGKQGGKLGAPIAYADTTIHSGDIAIMDADGVFVLSPSKAADLLPACKQKQAQDDHKLSLFLEAYQHQRLDELPL